MNRLFFYWILFLIFCSENLIAQKVLPLRSQDTVAKRVPLMQQVSVSLETFWKKNRPSMLRMGFDPLWQIVPLIGSNSLPSPFSTQEVNAELVTLQNKITFVLAAGNFNSKRVNFTNNKFFRSTIGGNFYRWGFDYNLIAKKTRLDAAYLGLRFSKATFNNRLELLYPEGYWLDDLDDFNRLREDLFAQGIVARWISVTIGFKVNVVAGLYAGIEGRLHLKPNISHAPTQFNVSEIPGYGLFREYTNSRYGYGYFLQYRIPLWK